MDTAIYIDWGQIDAIRDDLFSERFTETSSLKSALLNAKILITGEKGVGKTCLRLALVQTYAHRYAAICDLDFNEIMFDSIHHTLAALCDKEHLPPLNVLSGLWATLLLYDMVARTGAKPEFARACDEIMRTIEDALPGVPLKRRVESEVEGARGIVVRLQGTIDAFAAMFKKLDSAVDDYFQQDDERDKRAPPPPAASPSREFIPPRTELKATLNGLTSSEAIRKAQLAFSNLLGAHDAMVLLVADGLDRLQTTVKSRPGIQMMFEALMTAAYMLSTNRPLMKFWDIKLLIPYDRYLGARLRDRDKFEDIHHGIEWSLASLRELIRRRLSVCLDAPRSSFQQLWSRVFPARVFNQTYGIEEDSFDYIARHTMYRPRQLILILKAITDNRPVGSVQKSHIVNSVTAVCRRLASSFIDEYEIEYPEFKTFLAILQKEPNVMRLADFRELISLSRSVFDHDGHSISEVERKLFAMSFFGILRAPDPTDRSESVYIPPTQQGEKTYVVDYFFKCRRYETIDSARHDDFVALHPLFMHKLELRADSERIIG